MNGDVYKTPWANQVRWQVTKEGYHGRFLTPGFKPLKRKRKLGERQKTKDNNQHNRR